MVFCVILALAVWAGVAMQASHGYVGINFAGWTIESPIWLALVALILTSVLIVSVFKLIHTLVNLKAFFRRLRTERRLQRSKIKTTQGMLAYLEGDCTTAEEVLIHGTACIDLPFVNYIFAAKAAGELGHYEQANHYLQQAEDLTQDNDSVAYDLQRAKWLFQQNHQARALDLLEPLAKKYNNHPQVFKTIYEIYQHQKNWEKIVEIAPGLMKANVLSEKQGAEAQKQAYEELIHQAAAVSVNELKAFWKDIPKSYQADSHLVYVYANALLKYKLQDEAEAIIRQTLKRQWNEALIKLYGTIKSTRPQKQLVFAEQFLQSHPKSAILLLTTGRLSLHHQLWGKAQRYLEASLTLSPQPEAYAELGKLLMKLNKLEEAAEYFRRGFILLTNQQDLGEESFLGLGLDKSLHSMSMNSPMLDSERILPN